MILFIDKYDLIHKSQFGFNNVMRKSKRTEDCITLFMHL